MKNDKKNYKKCIQANNRSIWAKLYPKKKSARSQVNDPAGSPSKRLMTSRDGEGKMGRTVIDTVDL